jgi:hypothetical protein
MDEELKSSEETVTDEDEKVQMFIWQNIKDILVTIDDSDPFLTLLGTLSILYNRIKRKNMLNLMIQASNLQIKMEDKYFN